METRVGMSMGVERAREDLAVSQLLSNSLANPKLWQDVPAKVPPPTTLLCVTESGTPSAIANLWPLSKYHDPSIHVLRRLLRCVLLKSLKLQLVLQILRCSASCYCC